MKKALMHAHTAYMVTQFNIDNIKMLQELGYSVDVSCCWQDDDSAVSPEALKKRRQLLEDMGCNIIETASLRKISHVGELFSAYKTLKKACDDNRYEIVHTQSPIGGVICRLAMRKARKKYGTKVIYAAHGFHFFAGAPKANWLIYFNAEKYCSKFTDLLITINKEDYNNALNKGFKAKKIAYVPGAGVDTNKFVLSDEARKNVRKELNISDETTVLLSVGELIERKNHKEVFEALGMLKDCGYLESHKVMYLIAGRGKIEAELRDKIKELGLDDYVKMLGFRTDVADIFAASDIYVFPSHQEGLPVALMEAMSVGLPCVVSRIRGNVDLIQEGVGGYFFDSRNPNELVSAIKNMISLSPENRALFGKTNKETMKGFNKETVNSCMKELYEEVVK